ncbi:MAG: hypothetical protein HY794_16070 [Desulfarculus sp.]|nr:hypothetical protein [Desulfarculus sp.]
MSKAAPAFSLYSLGRAACCLGLALGLWLAAPGLAGANGDTRPATPQEKAFHAQALDACQQAAPAGPQGWDLVDRTQVNELNRVSTGLGKSPWPVSFRLAWQDSASLRAGEEKTMRAGLALLAQRQADQNFSQLQKQLDGLNKALGAALKNGDRPQAQQVQERMAPLVAQLQALQADFDRKFQEIQKENQPKDARASLSIQVNALYEEMRGPATEEPPLRGHRVWRGQGGHASQQGWREGVTLVLLGKWSLEKSGETTTVFTAQTDAGLPATTAQAVAVRLTADPARARQMLEALDWARLEGLLAR